MLRVRNEAKMNMRRFVDDVSFVVGKESRDRLKGIQRQLRDHYRGIANQTTRSLNESLQATLTAAKLEENERNSRVAELERQLNILSQVTDHATRLAVATQSAPQPVGRPEPSQPHLRCSGRCISWSTGYEHERSSARDPGRHHPGLPGRSGVPSAPRRAQRAGADRPRLNQPIRIALAGTLKAGKSTLVNALVGEDIAPTDATEATRIVTWFRNGPTPKVTANHRGGRRSNVPIARDGDGGLTFDFASLDPEDVVDLDVEWPAAELIDTTIIDTPGTSSLSRDVSRAHAAAAGARGRRAPRRRGGVPAAHAERRRHRAAQADRRARRRVGGGARRHRRGVACRRDRRGPHRRDAVGQGRGHAVHRGDGQDRHLPGRRPGVRTAGADRPHAAAERVRRAGEAGRGRRGRTDQGDAVGRPVRPRGQRAARRRRHPRRAARPVRHVRHPDLDRGAAGRRHRLGRRWPTNCSSAAG